MAVRLMDLEVGTVFEQLLKFLFNKILGYFGSEFRSVCTCISFFLSSTAIDDTVGKFEAANCVTAY
jgi:hypothetical protein